MNKINVPKNETKALAEIVAELEAKGVAYEVDLHQEVWRIKITGC